MVTNGCNGLREEERAFCVNPKAELLNGYNGFQNLV